MTARVLVTRPWPQAAIDHLAARYDCTVHGGDRPMTALELAAAMQEYDILCPTVTDRIDAAILGVEKRRVKLVANFGAGVDHIDIEAARRAGVAVSNTPDVLTDATADLALMLILMASRRASEGERQLRAGQWPGWSPTHMMGQGLRGRTLGLIGFGRIGRATAMRARAALGLQIVYHSRSRLRPDEEARLHAAYLPTIDALVAASDIVSLHCPGGGDRPLVDAALLARMKPGAILINTARGSLVDETALAEALKERRLFAAGLDVFADEPRVSSALLDCPNAVLLPHLGSATTDTRIAMGLRAAANIERFLAGEPLRDHIA